MDRILAFVRNKPRMTILIGAVLVGAGALVAWQSEGIGTLLAWAPLALCIGLHGLMHGSHGHSHRQTPTDPTTGAAETSSGVPAAGPLASGPGAAFSKDDGA